MINIYLIIPIKPTLGNKKTPRQTNWGVFYFNDLGKNLLLLDNLINKNNNVDKMSETKTATFNFFENTSQKSP